MESSAIIYLIIGIGIAWFVISNFTNIGTGSMNELADETVKEIFEEQKSLGDGGNFYVEASTLIMSSFYMEYGKGGVRKLAKYASMVRGKLIANGMSRATANSIQEQFKNTVDMQLRRGGGPW